MNNEKQGKRPAVDIGALHPKLIVGIGGSAGALFHMNPSAISQLAKILSRHTKMNIGGFHSDADPFESCLLNSSGLRSSY